MTAIRDYNERCVSCGRSGAVRFYGERCVRCDGPNHADHPNHALTATYARRWRAHPERTTIGGTQ